MTFIISLFSRVESALVNFRLENQHQNNVQSRVTSAQDWPFPYQNMTMSRSWFKSAEDFWAEILQGDNVLCVLSKIQVYIYIYVYIYICIIDEFIHISRVLKVFTSPFPFLKHPIHPQENDLKHHHPLGAFRSHGRSPLKHPPVVTATTSSETSGFGIARF